MASIRPLVMSRRQALTVFAGVAAVGALPTCYPPSRAEAAVLVDPVETGLPDTERGRAVWAYKTGGRAVRAAAATALVGSAADVTEFLEETLPVARAEDNRFSLFAALPLAGRGVRDAIGVALAGGDDAIAEYLRDGYEAPVLEDLRFAVFVQLNNGGTAVRREAEAALEAGTPEELRAFLGSTRFTAQAEDDRFQVFSMLPTASPWVNEYAQRALADGSPETIRRFLASGQYIARARDEEAATIDQLVTIVEDEGRRADLNAEMAVDLSAKAVDAADKARTAAQEAEAEARAAAGDVERSAKAADARRVAEGARDAAAKAIQIADVADETARAAGQADVAASAAASAASRAATAAAAVAAAAQAAGAAGAEAEKAQQAAVAAEAASVAAAAAAVIAKQLAQASARAARTARDSARSAADHALNAADAADEAADHAGDAIDFANRSTLSAAAAVEAANAAREAVNEAVTVEQAAREAEAAWLAEEAETARRLAAANRAAEEAALQRVDAERTQWEAFSDEVRTLVSDASAALRGGSTAEAVETARRAAMKMLVAPAGAWTQQAAEFALAGSDADVVNWIDADRLLAEQQDDLERILAMTNVAPTAVVSAAVEAAQTGDADVMRTFLESGAVEAEAEENRFRAFRILAGDPGSAVRAAVDAALDDGSPRALRDLIRVGWPEALKEDESVEVFRLLNTGGPYTRAAADVVLAGSVQMRHAFLVNGQFETGQLDHDSATHVSAVRAAIAHARKVAAEAMADAARASRAAAIARDAAAEAAQWAARAEESAEDAAQAALDARSNADAADESAASAAESAASAARSAAVAYRERQEANFWAKRAVASASTAVSHAERARAAGAAAWEAAVAAGEDADTAAAAASQAREDFVEREARQASVDRMLGNLVDSIAIDQGDLVPGADEDGDTTLVGLWPKDISDPKDWTKALGNQSYFMSVNSLAWSWRDPVSEVFGTYSQYAAIAAAYTAGHGYGWESSEFYQAAGAALLGVISSELGPAGPIIDGYLIVDGLSTGSEMDCVYEEIGREAVESFENPFGVLFR